MSITYAPVNINFEQLPGTKWGPENAFVFPISPRPMATYSDYIVAQANGGDAHSDYLMFRLGRKNMTEPDYEVVAEYGSFETLEDVLAKYRELDKEQREKDTRAVYGGYKYGLGT